MLPLVLILLLGLTAFRGFVFGDTYLYEGDPCSLSNDNTKYGQCRKYRECERKHIRLTSECGYTGGDPIVCCDVIQRQCENYNPPKSAFVDHILVRSSVVDVGEFPFMALVIFDDPIYSCGASLISKRFLLTAAHCRGFNKNSKPIAVKLGTTEANDEQVKNYAIKRFVSFDSYRPLLKQNDIAIIELEESVTYSSNVRAICLHTNQDELPESTDLIATGWGEAGDSDNLAVSNTLLKGTVRPIGLAKCRAWFSVLPRGLKLSENQLCALGGPNEDEVFTAACGGDSGGPLVLERDGRRYLVGILSAGKGCASEDFAGIYTKVNKYLSWIIRTVVWDESP